MRDSPRREESPAAQKGAGGCPALVTRVFLLASLQKAGEHTASAQQTTCAIVHRNPHDNRTDSTLSWCQQGLKANQSDYYNKSAQLSICKTQEDLWMDILS